MGISIHGYIHGYSHGYPRKKSVDMDVDMDGKFHIHGKPALDKTFWRHLLSVAHGSYI